MKPMYRRRDLLSRRHFLRGSIYGAGVTLGLPLLEAMVGSGKSALAAPSPKRFIAAVVPNGIMMQNWTPSTVGAGYSIPSGSILEPLAAHKSDFTVITGLASLGSYDPATTAATHGKVLLSLMSGRLAYHTTDATQARGFQTVDQRMVTALAPNTARPSVTLATEQGAGDTDDFARIYSGTLSWKDSNAQGYVNPEMNPTALFRDLFSGVNPGGSGGSAGTALTAVQKRRKSILDLVIADAKTLKTLIGTADQRRMDQYLTQISDLEKRLVPATGTGGGGTPAPACTVPNAPGSYSRLDAHLRLFFDLLVVAFQCDLTRIATILFSSEGSNRTYPEIGVGSHHDLSHHQNNAGRIADNVKINRYHTGLLAELLAKMKQSQDGNGNTLLSQSAVLYGCGLADSNEHSCGSLPLLVAGQCGGAIRQNPAGMHVAFPVTDQSGQDYRPNPTENWHKPFSAYTTVCNLHVKLLNAMGVNDTQFGDSTGRVTQLD